MTPRSFAARLRELVLAGAVLSYGCDAKVEPLEDARSQRGTLGEEVYKVLCRRVAGVELPADADGSQSERLCLGDAGTVRQEVAQGGRAWPDRLRALADARAELVDAVDVLLPAELGDELELLMREMLPFYDPPAERVQASSRALASALRRLANDDAALDGLALLAREGMTAFAGAFGSTRALGSAAGLEPVLTQVLPALTEADPLRAQFETLLSGLALELASASDADDRADAQDRKTLLVRPVQVASTAALLVAVRDARGLPVPHRTEAGALPFPFVDADGDGLADVRAGEFVLSPSFGRALPSPFPSFHELDVARDARGAARAFASNGTADSTRNLFEARDLSTTVLHVGLEQLAPLLAPERHILEHATALTPALFGPRTAHSKSYQAAKLAFAAPDAAHSPFVDLTHAANALVDVSAYGDSLALTRRVLVEHEPELAQAIAPWLALERNTRNESDLYPAAALADKSTLWDELLLEVERLSRKRTTRDGETTAEGLLRAALGYARDLSVPERPLKRLMSLDALRHQGAILAALMRFKDEWRANPKGESKREPGEDRVRGAFRVPVDRGLGDVPVTCGKDGCGGLLEGSPFADWLRKSAQQKCLLGNEGRSGSDCGTASNQSLYQRSLGLIWEMAGRAQQNKRITVGDLLDFAVLEDPCATLDPALACAGANLAAKDAYCEAQFGSADFACDEARNLCIAERTSATCQAYRQAQQQDRAQSIALAEDAVAQDYTCPAGEPGAACHAYQAEYPAAFIVGNGLTEAAIQEGHLLDLRDVGRAFGRALIHDFVIEVPNPWVRRYLEDVARAADRALPTCNPGDIDDPALVPHRNSDAAECVPNAAKLSRDVYQDMPGSVDTLGELVEFLLDDSSLFEGDADTAALRPEVEALSRVLFAPPGSSSFIVFDPLLVKGAPGACMGDAVAACALNQGPLDAAGSCCLADLSAPPLRFRLDTYYGATTFAWEHPFEFGDGQKLSFIQSMRTLADAIDRTDFHAEAGDDPREFESTDYAFSALGKLVAEHYDSNKNTLAQATSPQGMHYRRLSNLVSYEPMIADALDDGTIRDALVDSNAFPQPAQHLGLMFHGLPMLEAVSGLTFANGHDGIDGIDVTSDLLELALSAHARCAGTGGDRRVLGGTGACQHAEAHEVGFVAPLTYRDGTATICWEDGRCFASAQDRRYVSPTYLLLDAVGRVDDALTGSARSDARAALGSMLDAYALFDAKGFRDRRLHALIVSLLDHVDLTWRDDQASGKLAGLRDARTQDAAELVENPVFASGLATMEGLRASEHSLERLSAYVFALLGQAPSRAALTLGLGDALESTPGTSSTDAAFRGLGALIVPDLDSVLAGKAPLDVESGYLLDSLTLLRDTSTRDRAQVVTRVLANLSALSTRRGASPLHALWSVLMRMQRAQPGSGATLDRADLKLMLTSVADVLTDQEHGFERLYEMVRCRDAAAGCR